MLSSAYRILTDLGSPVIGIYLRRRLEQGREDRERFPERLGNPSLPRPEGRLVWCHAASVGEATAFLALIEKMRELYPETSILITTGTVTSARMLEGRLPPGVIHQYVPVDRVPYIRKFLDHWKPDLALWIESELWPNTLAEIRARKIPAALLNGTMSDKSLHNWRRVKGWAQQILGAFNVCLTQTEEDRTRYALLGAKPVHYVGNLKYAGKRLPFDIRALRQLQESTAGRTLWLMASTHAGEEEMALNAHEMLRAQYPNLLTVIVPRHAVRGNEIAHEIIARALTFARRSKNEPITPQTGIYLADTMGELGLFYRLCRIMCMGGSFVPVGGHNPIEPAQLECAILLGPDMHSFSEVAAEFVARQGAVKLNGPDEIALNVSRLLASPESRDRMAYNARTLAEEKRHVLDRVLEALEPWLGPKNEGKPEGSEKVA